MVPVSVYQPRSPPRVTVVAQQANINQLDWYDEVRTLRRIKVPRGYGGLRLPAWRELIQDAGDIVTKGGGSGTGAWLDDAGRVLGRSGDAVFSHRSRWVGSHSSGQEAGRTDARIRPDTERTRSAHALLSTQNQSRTGAGVGSAVSLANVNICHRVVC